MATALRRPARPIHDGHSLRRLFAFAKVLTLNPQSARNLLRRLLGDVERCALAATDDVLALRTMLTTFVADGGGRDRRAREDRSALGNQRDPLAASVAAMAVEDRALLFLFFGLGLSLASTALVLQVAPASAAQSLAGFAEQLTIPPALL